MPESVDSPASGPQKVHINPRLFNESAGIVSGSALPAAHSTATRPPRSQSFPYYERTPFQPPITFPLASPLSSTHHSHRQPRYHRHQVHKGFSTTQDTVAFISRLYLTFNRQPGTVDIPYYQ
ncbi:hypothetical protein PtA15_17A72 [Puccinia triticina]|uniref:Uncharacterized protein n=1 Tax=Puccinia triticina TaxID=208348 RepID=A0ABY7D8E1_9BASI|nr:uncharacterized protein PtA15_17A72 [Puccinia triticina]WAQ92591.1 hypothetical protein PtA15_17A72 [Puccinia triticina]